LSTGDRLAVTVTDTDADTVTDADADADADTDADAVTVTDADARNDETGKRFRAAGLVSAPRPARGRYRVAVSRPAGWSSCRRRSP
jgi:hypothetical protein